MGRIVLVVLLVAISVWLAVGYFITTDAERVEAEIERLLGVAREGGEEAAAEILAVVDEDYHGAGYFSRERLADYVRRFVAEERAEEIWTGDYIVVPKGGAIVVPLFRIHAKTRRFEGDALLRLTWIVRDGSPRLVSVDQWRSER